MKDLLTKIYTAIVLVTLFAIMPIVAGLAVLGAISIWIKVLSFF